MPEPTYDLDYALSRLRDAIDYAEMTRDPSAFIGVRLWFNNVEKSANELKPIITVSGVDHTELQTILDRHPELFVQPDTVLVDTLPGEQSAEGSS